MHLAAKAMTAALVLLVAGAAIGAPFVPPAPPTQAAAVPPTPRAILKMALEAPRLIDYEGTKIITALRNGRMETVTVAESHKRPNLLRLEYLSPEDVAGRVIVDDGTTARHYEPALNMLFEDHSLQDGGAAAGLTLSTRSSAGRPTCCRSHRTARACSASCGWTG
jgi:outer membrane lipoprotein-sorting protein